MRKILALAVLTAFIASTGCVAPPPRRTAYRNRRPAAPVQCVSHQPLSYSPIMTKVNVNFSYNLKNPDQAHEWTPATFVDSLRATNPGKYQLADGVNPNLILTINISNDGHDHFGATLDAYGNGEGFLFHYSWNQDYVTGTKLLGDIAGKVNTFVTYGWNNGHCGY